MGLSYGFRSAIAVLLALALSNCGNVPAGVDVQSRSASPVATPAKVAAPAVAIPKSDAQIVIETNSHSAAVRRLDVSVERGLVVTAAEDKSARIWDLESGALKQVLRPRSGQGRAGLLYGAAIHPRDDLVAVAGSVPGVDTADASGSIVLYSLSDGAYQGAINAGDGDIKDLAWSSDGSVLLAVYARSNVLRAFNRRGEQVYERRFQSPAYALTAGTDGRVAAASFNGTVVLVSARNGRAAQSHSFRVRGKQVSGLTLSPDGGLLVVGYHRAGAAPEVYLPNNGNFVRRLPMPSLRAGAIDRVSFDYDGRYLVASGRGYVSQINQVPVFWYDTSSWQLAGSTVAAGNSVLDLAPLPGGEFVFGSFDASWGVVGRQKRRLRVASVVPDLRRAEDLSISANGATVAWRFDNGKRGAAFDFATRTIVQDTSGLLSPKTRRSLFEAPQWRNQAAPEVNGASIAMAPGELGRSISYFRNGSDHALFGTSQRLMRLSGSGAVVWQKRVVGEVRAINVTADDQTVVTAMSDGTIRWWRASDGNPLLSLLATRNRKWVAWLPTGHFDASVGADRLAGWAVNRSDGPSANFFKLNQVRKVYNQPLMIDEVFRTLDPSLAVRNVLSRRETGVSLRLPDLAAQQTSPSPEKFPPVLDSQSTRVTRIGADKLALSFKVDNIGGGDLNVTVSANGRPLPDVAVRLDAPANASQAGVVTVQRPAVATTYRLLVENASGVSAPASAQFVPDPEQPATTLAAVSASPGGGTKRPPPALIVSQPTGQSHAVQPPKPVVKGHIEVAPPTVSVATARPAARSEATATGGSRLFILAIGISQYQRKEYELLLAAKDATDFARVMKSQAASLYSDVLVRTLTDSQATRRRIRSEFEWLNRSVRDTDVVAVFMAGHGLNHRDGSYYFVSHETDAKALPQTGLSERVIRKALINMRGKVLLFVDTCHGGAALSREGSLELARMANNLSSPENGVIVFASSEGRQLSLEKAEWGNGAFTAALLKGLSGQASYGSGRVTVKGLDFFVSEEVRRLTNGLQTPVSISPIGIPDFVLVRS